MTTTARWRHPFVRWGRTRVLGLAGLVGLGMIALLTLPPRHHDAPEPPPSRTSVVAGSLNGFISDICGYPIDGLDYQGHRAVGHHQDLYDYIATSEDGGSYNVEVATPYGAGWDKVAKLLDQRSDLTPVVCDAL